MILETLAGGAVAAALGFSARWNWWRPRTGGLPILMYHKIGDSPPGSKLKKLWVSTDRFRRQMDYLRRNGYKPLRFLDAAAILDRGEKIPPESVIITFDDGYKNNYENAFPVLREFDFKAVIYVVVNAVGRDNFWHDPSSETRVPMLSWAEISEMESEGMEFGSHTMNHAKLSRIPVEKVAEELRESRRILAEKLRNPLISFANPYGDGQDDVKIQNMIREAGYRWAVSVHQGKADLAAEPYRLRRLFVRGDDTDWDFHLNMSRGRARF